MQPHSDHRHTQSLPQPQNHRRPLGSCLQSQAQQGGRAKPSLATPPFSHRHAQGPCTQRSQRFGDVLSSSGENKFCDKNYHPTSFCIKEKARFFPFFGSGRVTGWPGRADTRMSSVQRSSSGNGVRPAQLSPQSDKESGGNCGAAVAPLSSGKIPKGCYVTFPLQHISPLLTISLTWLQYTASPQNGPSHVGLSPCKITAPGGATVELAPLLYNLHFA